MFFDSFGKQSLRGVGKALPGIDLLIVHLEDHTPVLQGTKGLILAREPNIFSGYINPGLVT
jgi:long-chain-fatty-acid--[acyl-carrier-protein] ligase